MMLYIVARIRAIQKTKDEREKRLIFLKSV
jgi:hypothetical protein